MSNTEFAADIKQLFWKLQNYGLVRQVRDEKNMGTQLFSFIPDAAWMGRPDAPYVEPDDLIVLGVS